MRQMLLEHTAASLILSAAYDSQNPKPEDSPVVQNEVGVEVDPFNIEVSDVASVARESIKIYADYGVFGEGDMADLLADIERQMETMNGSRQPPSFSEYSIVA